MSLAKQLLDIYGGNPYHAQARTGEDGKSTYYELIEEPLSEELMEKHLKGEITLGCYPIDHKTSHVKFMTWDIDSAGDIESARDIVKKLLPHISHMPYALSFSGNKGYHLSLYFESPIQASVAKEIGEAIRAKENLPKSGNPHVEVFPKQSHISGKSNGNSRNTGNLIKIPLGKHPLTHNFSTFVDARNGFENGVPLSAEQVLSYRIKKEDFLDLRNSDKTTLENLAKAIAVEWDSGRRHDLCLYLSGYLAQIGWTFENVWSLVEIILSERPDDDDTYNRKQAIEDTFRRHNRGMNVAGFQSLSEIISGGLMKKISEEAPILISPTIARQIDNTRFSKGPTWKKERDAANLIWNWLTDRENGGRILRVDPTGLKQEWHIYYFSQNSRSLISMDDPMFDDVLYKSFNLNIAEAFAVKVKGILIRRARTLGEEIKIHKRSIFQDGKLYINLGGIHTYVLNGKDEPEIILNGDQGIFFVTNNPSAVVPEFDGDMDVWEELIETINFETSDNAPMKPDEQKQLLKAWVISYFFRKILPTRPILSLMGLPGSGKTTAIRQILRMVEGLDHNVSGITDERSDAWRSMLEHNSMIVLDNLEESNVKWMSRALDLVATGQIIEIRKLYTTNEMYRINPDVYVALTAVEMPFSKDTVFERMLVLNMKKLNSFIPSHVIEENLRNNLSKLWGSLLNDLNEVVNILNIKKPPRIAMQIRMADFANFCMWIKEASVFDTKALEDGLRYLATAQQVALALSSNSIYPVLLEWVENNPSDASKPRKIGELYDLLKTLSSEKGNKFYWKTNSALSRHLTAMEVALKTSLGMEIELRYDSNRGRNEKIYRFIPFGEDFKEEENEVVEEEEVEEEDGKFVIDLERKSRK